MPVWKLIVGSGVLALAAGAILGFARPETVAPRGSPPPLAASPIVDLDGIDVDGAADRLSSALRLRTVAAPVTGLVPREALDAAERFLCASYPDAAALRRAGAGDAIVLRWPGRDGRRAPVVLLAHLDVVPAPDPAAWTHPPFDGRIADGAVWGRGALDDKGSAIALLEAVQALRGRGFMPARTVYVVLGTDEERSGAAAAAVAAELRAEHGGGPALVLDEGGFLTQGMTPGVGAVVARIGVAEKGYLSLRLTAAGAAGHSSVPAYPTAIGRLASAVARLERTRRAPRLDGASAMMVERLAGEMPFGLRVLYGNLWLFGPVAARVAAADPRLAALTRTTVVATAISAGGEARNVVPPEAAATVNLRLLPGDSVEAVTRWVRGVVARDGVRADVIGPAVEPTDVGRAVGAGFRLVERTLAGLEPLQSTGVIAAPALATGTTDSRHFLGPETEILRFLPFVVTPGDAGGVHGANERLSLANLRLGIGFYTAILRRLGELD
jgi:carboxypeptidase PM20D1